MGVLDVQGDVAEHVNALQKSKESLGLDATVLSVRDKDVICRLHALLIPGGESTTISMLMEKYDLDEAVRGLAAEGAPIMGTCAGLVLMSSGGGSQVEMTGQKLLSLMDVRVERNAYGRQVDSFEADLQIPVIGGGSFSGVFIRAPVMAEVGAGVKPLCRLSERIVMASQDNLLGLTFHPELTGDTRIHEFFLGMV
ncbi:pyridoxal 5'-phosphate synthase glutaminase subunit PdxT [Candidatus Altiarchaeota archaeon]